MRSQNQAKREDLEGLEASVLVSSELPEGHHTDWHPRGNQDRREKVVSVHEVEEGARKLPGQPVVKLLAPDFYERLHRAHKIRRSLQILDCPGLPLSADFSEKAFNHLDDRSLDSSSGSQKVLGEHVSAKHHSILPLFRPLPTDRVPPANTFRFQEPKAIHFGEGHQVFKSLGYCQCVRRQYREGDQATSWWGICRPGCQREITSFVATSISAGPCGQPSHCRQVGLGHQAPTGWVKSGQDSWLWWSGKSALRHGGLAASHREEEPLDDH